MVRPDRHTRPDSGTTRRQGVRHRDRAWRRLQPGHPSRGLGPSRALAAARPHRPGRERPRLHQHRADPGPGVPGDGAPRPRVRRGQKPRQRAGRHRHVGRLMYIAAAVVSALFAAALLISARSKLVKGEAVIAGMAKVGVPADKLWLLGAAAAIGLILYFLGAIASHLRVRDKAIAPATVLLIVAVAALTLRATTT